MRILERLYDIQGELERVGDDLQANQREYEQLTDRRHELASEHDRLHRKLLLLDEAER